MKIADCGFDDRCKAENEENYLQRWKIQQEETKERLRLTLENISVLMLTLSFSIQIFKSLSIWTRETGQTQERHTFSYSKHKEIRKENKKTKIPNSTTVTSKSIKNENKCQRKYSRYKNQS